MNASLRLGELRAVVRAYVRQCVTLDYASIRRSQSAPWPSLAYGAAGTAYMLWRLARGSELRVRAAKTLLAGTEHADPADYWDASFGPSPDLGGSLADGLQGGRAVSVLIAHSYGDARTYERQLTTFVRACHSRRGAESELLFGAAGTLSGATLLWRATRDDRFRGAADLLARRLRRRAFAGDRPWALGGKLGFAHGIAGILHALLSYREAARLAPSPFERRMLAACADRADAAANDSISGHARSRDRDLRWCNGAAGQALLWAKAFEVTGEARYLRLARADAEALSAGIPDAIGSLCCGLGGQAYATLAMDRIEPGRGWDERAIELTYESAKRLLRDKGCWPNGLYNGFPGLACLVDDLGRGARRRVGFPFVEGVA